LTKLWSGRKRKIKRGGKKGRREGKKGREVASKGTRAAVEGPYRENGQREAERKKKGGGGVKHLWQKVWREGAKTGKT